MSLKINTCENLWSNFSANLIVVALLEQNQFEWPNLSIYFNFLCAVPRGDVTKKTRFLMSHLLSFQHGWYIPHAEGSDVHQVNVSEECGYRGLCDQLVHEQRDSLPGTSWEGLERQRHSCLRHPGLWGDLLNSARWSAVHTVAYWSSQFLIICFDPIL